MIKELEQIGLSPAQAKILDILISQGPSNPAQLIKESRISASNVYIALDKLKERGIVTKIMVNERPQYKTSISELKKILALSLDEEKEHKQAALERIGQIISTKSEAKASQDAEIFVGTHNLRTAYAHLFSNKSTKDEFIFFYKYEQATGDIVHSFFSKMDINDYYKNTPTRALFSTNYKQLLKQRKNAKFEAKFTEQPIPSSINVYQDKTLIIHWSNVPTAYLLTSKEIADNFRNLFNDTWNIVK